ncbi:DUF2157 domain-containing protein [Microcoleus sp. ZQ-A2]|nr:DUF2157 domain-containing protein [Microcoleus sp. FACHB-1]
MLSEKFRRQLRQEVEQWRTEELIDDFLYEQLSQRYLFGDIEASARNRFIIILLGLGSVLLGLAIITFVAANWQAWSRGLKVILLLSGFVGINTAGFYLWRHPTEGWQRRLGQGLLVLGALVLGANMALMSQMFHQSGLLYQLYLVWGLGVLAMAYCLRLTLLGMLSALLIGLGYLTSLWGSSEFGTLGEFSWLRLMVQYMPVLGGLMFIPLAYWCRSRWIFRIAIVAMVFSLEASLIRLDVVGSSGWMAAIACALPPALLWAYSDSLWKIPPTAESFDGIARTLAVTFLSLLFYVLSFLGIWNTPSDLSADVSSKLPLPLLLDILLLSGLTLWEWGRLLVLRRVNLPTSVVAGMIILSAFVPYWHLNISRSPTVAVLIFNLLLFLLAVGLIREGLSQGQRRLFWGGMVLLTLQIFSRMLEYNTDLLFKSFVLLLCGLGVIAAGLWFERYVRTMRS